MRPKSREDRKARRRRVSDVGGELPEYRAAAAFDDPVGREALGAYVARKLPFSCRPRRPDAVKGGSRFTTQAGRAGLAKRPPDHHRETAPKGGRSGQILDHRASSQPCSPSRRYHSPPPLEVSGALLREGSLPRVAASRRRQNPRREQSPANAPPRFVRSQCSFCCAMSCFASSKRPSMQPCGESGPTGPRVHGVHGRQKTKLPRAATAAEFRLRRASEEVPQRGRRGVDRQGFSADGGDGRLSGGGVQQHASIVTPSYATVLPSEV